MDDVLFFKSTVAGWFARDGLGRPPFVVAALSLHYRAQRRRGPHGVDFELVVWTGHYPLAQTIEIWPGIPGQSRRNRRPGGAGSQQKRNADHGRHFDCDDSIFHHHFVDAIEQQAGFIDAPFRARFDRPRILRRLRKNHPAKWRRHPAARQIVHAVCREYFHRRLFVYEAFDGQAGFRNYGSVSTNILF